MATVLGLSQNLWAQQNTQQPPVPKSGPVPRTQSDDSDTKNDAPDGKQESKADSSGNSPSSSNSNAKSNSDTPDDEAAAPPPSANESSSKESRGDSAPPPDDKRKHPDSAAAIQEAEGSESGDSDTGATTKDVTKDAAKDKQSAADNTADDVQEFHPWDPHRALKNIEVGDYYFKRKNFAGAEGRYREALLYKPGDAIATFQLAECLDKTGRGAEAKQFYASYLHILPSGPSAEEAKQALARLGGVEPAPNTASKSAKNPK